MLIEQVSVRYPSNKQCYVTTLLLVPCLLDLNPCTLVCKIGRVAYPHGNVIDGTRCSKERYDYDVCIQGQCQVLIPLAVNGR